MGFAALLFSIVLIVICALFLAMCIIYIILLVKYHDESTGNIVISCISLVFLVIIAVIGIVAVIKKSRTLCLYFGVIMIVLAIFCIIQLVLFGIGVNFLVPHRDEVSQSAENLFWAVTIILLLIAIVGAVDAFLLRWKIEQKKSGGNYYE